MVKTRLLGRFVGSMCAFLLAFQFTSVAPLQAADEEEGSDDERSYESVVVQNRLFEPTHEFTGTVGVLPMDAFAKSVTASASYTLHFSDRWAWEVAHFNYSFHVETDLNDKLASFDIRPTPFELLEYHLASNAVFKPLYWKGSWLNDSLVRGELLLTAGGAYGWFTRSGRPGVSVGTGFRLITSERLSFRFDTRYLAFGTGFGGGDFTVDSELWLGLGTSLSF